MVRLRQFAKLEYGNPHGFLSELRKFEYTIAATDTPLRLKTMRTNRLKREREMRDAALFCVGMSHNLGSEVLCAPVEAGARRDASATRRPTLSATRRQGAAQTAMKAIIAANMSRRTGLAAEVSSMSTWTAPLPKHSTRWPATWLRCARRAPRTKSLSVVLMPSYSDQTQVSRT